MLIRCLAESYIRWLMTWWHNSQISAKTKEPKKQFAVLRRVRSQANYFFLSFFFLPTSKSTESKQNVTDHVYSGRHGVGFVLIWKVCHVYRVQVCNVVGVLLARQWRKRVSQCIEALANVGIHVNINTAHFPKHIQSPGTSTTALCFGGGGGKKK